MKASKVIVKINIETLSLDSVPVLLHEVAAALGHETETGLISKADGDEIAWETSYRAVEF